MAATSNRYADTPGCPHSQNCLWSSSAMHQTAMLSDNRDNIHHHWVLFVPTDLPHSPSLRLLSCLSSPIVIFSSPILPPLVSFAILLYLNKHLSLKISRSMKDDKIYPLSRKGRKIYSLYECECLPSSKYCDSVVETLSAHSIVSPFGALDRVCTTKDTQLYNISGMSRLKPIHIDVVTNQQRSALRSCRAATVSSGTRSNPQFGRSYTTVGSFCTKDSSLGRDTPLFSMTTV